MNSFNYKIYQIKKEYQREKGFLDLEDRAEFLKDDAIYLSEYNNVYSASIDSDNKNETLEKLFRIFNLEHPHDYQGRSLSVGDIVNIDDTYYFCDRIGWREVSINN